MSERNAKYGEKTIKLTVYLFTENIAKEESKVEPKHAWTNGSVSLISNKTHGITSGDRHPFNSLLEIPKAIEDALIEGEITLHPTGKMKKYIVDNN